MTTRGMRGAIMQDPHNAEFWGLLGGEIAVTAAGESDDAADKAAYGSVSLMWVLSSVQKSLVV